MKCGVVLERLGWWFGECGIFCLSVGWVYNLLEFKCLGNGRRDYFIFDVKLGCIYIIEVLDLWGYFEGFELFYWFWIRVRVIWDVRRLYVVDIINFLSFY